MSNIADLTDTRKKYLSTDENPKGIDSYLKAGGLTVKPWLAYTGLPNMNVEVPKFSLFIFQTVQTLQGFAI